METRIDLSEDAISVASELAEKSGRTISELIEELVRDEARSTRADIYEERRQKIERDIAAAVEAWRQRQSAG
jgi:hypothetical protein